MQGQAYKICWKNANTTCHGRVPVLSVFRCRLKSATRRKLKQPISMGRVKFEKHLELGVVDVCRLMRARYRANAVFVISLTSVCRLSSLFPAYNSNRTSQFGYPFLTLAFPFPNAIQIGEIFVYRSYVEAVTIPRTHIEFGFQVYELACTY